jgi:hypothetical protein
VSVADLPFRCAGGPPATISLGPVTPMSEPIASRYGLCDDRDTHCLLPGSLAHTHAGRLAPASRPPSPPARKSNLHSARGTAGAKLPATSCLGAFWTPAVRARRTLRHPASKNLHRTRLCAAANHHRRLSAGKFSRHVNDQIESGQFKTTGWPAHSLLMMRPA